VSAVFFAAAGMIATRRMLWNDELFTLYISRLDGFSDILGALATGADQNPPPFYFLTHGFLRVMGESPFVVRLPEVLGVLLMGLCLFFFVSNRLPALYGIAAMVFPYTTIAFEYAYEARPYGLVLGFSGLALLCWQMATERKRRIWWLLALGASGAAGISCHYYAVFLLFPLAVGELVRSWVKGRFDVPMWAALGIMLIPLIIFMPLVEQARTYSQHFWARPEWRNIPAFFYFLLTPSLGPIIATLIAASVWPAADQTPDRPPDRMAYALPPHEIAAALGFISVPVIAVASARAATGAFTNRYALMAVIGFSILGPLAFLKAYRKQAIIGGCLTSFMLIWFLMAAATQIKHQASIEAGWRKTYQLLEADDGSELPIVAADLHSFMTFVQYGPQRLQSRIVYLADPVASIRHLGHDTVDRGILDLRPWFHVPVETYGSFAASHERYLVYARVRGNPSWLGYYWIEPVNLNWLFCELYRAPVQIELKSWFDNDLLFLVSADIDAGSKIVSEDGPPAPGVHADQGLRQITCGRM